MADRKSIPFTKASGCGNDFLIIQSAHRPANATEFTRRICDRHNGIGADGVEWITAGGRDADVTADLINADGSFAEVSGNGTRCVAAWWHNRKVSQQPIIRVLTGAGIKECRVTSHSGQDYTFDMRIGVPQIKGSVTVDLPAAKFVGLMLDMGNPQFVTFVQDFDFPWQARGAEIQAQSAHFPEGVNVDFVRIVGPQQIESRFFERGAGETMSSGTGSCASAIASIHAGHTKSPVTVVSPGGAQLVTWNNEVSLQGPARLICDGEFFV